MVAKMQIDLYADWINMQRSSLHAMGYAVDPKDDGLEVSVKHFNVLKRKVVARPRTILQSKEFNCPSDLQTAIDAFKAVAANGGDLTPHLSRTLLDAEYNDALLNHWGIHHFHLGNAIEKDGFIQRSNRLLFSRITDDRVYLIDVMQHGDWAKQKLVEIIHSNWPDSIERFRLKGIHAQSLSDEDIAKCRKAGVEPGVSAGGNMYFPFGGGYVSTGVSADAVMFHDAISKQLRRLEEHVKLSPELLIDAAKKQGIPLKSPLALRLLIGTGGEFLLRDEPSNSVFRIVISA
ncbi:MAG: hypothetical protein ACYCPQ_00650 [Elusimicrobiota bacterium]